MDITTTTTSRSAAERNAKGQFLRGHTGLPGGGRPRGSRSKLGEQFITDLQVDWRAHGPEVIAAVRRDDPGTYMTIVSRLLPTEIAIGSPGDFGRCGSIAEVIDALLSDFEDPRDLLSSFDEMRAALVERLGDQARPVRAASVEPD